MSADRYEYPLAPMSGDLRLITQVAYAVPVLLVLAGLRPPPLFVVAALVLLVYLSVWLWLRPTRFVLTRNAFVIEWPARRLEVPLADITAARVLTRADFRREFRYGLRIGAGGLWGGFGLLATGSGTLTMYVSRTDRFVLAERASGRSMLLSPEPADGRRLRRRPREGAVTRQLTLVVERSTSGASRSSGWRHPRGRRRPPGSPMARERVERGGADPRVP